MSREAERTLKELQRKFPIEYNSSLKTLAMGLRKKAREGMDGSGPVPLPQLKGESKFLNKRSSLGGKLRTSIKAFSKNGSVYVGWPDGLTKYSDLFQSSEYRKRTKKELRLLKKRGLKEPDKFYSRVERPLWSPLLNWTGFTAYVLKVITKKINAMVKKSIRTK